MPLSTFKQNHVGAFSELLSRDWPLSPTVHNSRQTPVAAVDQHRCASSHVYRRTRNTATSAFKQNHVGAFSELLSRDWPLSPTVHNSRQTPVAAVDQHRCDGRLAGIMDRWRQR